MIGRSVLSAIFFGGLGRVIILAESAAPADLAQVRDLAERSDPAAQNTLGNAYSAGNGVAQDYAAALGWYRRAAEQGFAPAEFNLALAYELARGVPADVRQAFKYYMMAAEQGFGPAQFNVGNMYSAGRGVGQDLFEANLWYKQAAEKGIVEARFNLGLAYETGRGVSKDEAQAARWYRSAADRGFSRAQYNLGLLLEEGRGVEKNETAAAAMYRAAADQGFASAQNNYGLMMAEGRGGLAKDPVQALVWLTLAVQNGARPAARDFIAQGLTAAQLSEVAQLVEARRAGTAVIVPEPARLSSGMSSEAAKNSVENAVSEVSGGTPGGIVPMVSATGLQDQVRDLRREKTELENKVGVIEQALNQKTAAARVAESAAAELQKSLTQVQQQLDEANRALKESGVTVAELVAANERLEAELKSAKSAVPVVAARDTAPAKADPTDLAAIREERASLREENKRLSQAGVEAAALRVKNEQLSRDNEQLKAFMNGSREDLNQSQTRVAELRKQLDALKAAPPPAVDEPAKHSAVSGNATGANASDAELAALQGRVKELEGQVEERNGMAKEIATMASQLQGVREANRSLSEANRVLLAAKESAAGASAQELDQLRRQNQSLTDAGRKVTAERDAFKGQLQDALKAAAASPAWSDEKAALEERLDGMGKQALKYQQELDALHKDADDLATRLAQAREAADKARSDLAAQQTRLADAEKTAESYNTSVADLTQANTKLQHEKEDLGRMVDSFKIDIARLTQNLRDARQQRADAERGGQQSLDAATAQLVQLQREVENARAAQARVAQAATVQDRERAIVIAQLRQENSALSVRLTKAQGTLDQIAAAARLGTPAAAQESNVRYHAVSEGDSLSRISTRYYGTPNRWQEIFQANREALQGSNSLRIGMQLRIP